MAKVVVTTNTNEIVLDITTWKDDDIMIRGKVLPAVIAAIENAYERDTIDRI